MCLGGEELANCEGCRLRLCDFSVATPETIALYFGALRWFFSLRIDGGAPAVVPIVLNDIQVSALAFGGTALLNARCGILGHGIFAGVFGSQFNALWGLLVQALRRGGWTPHVAQPQDHHRFGLVTLTHLN